jgi:hypothetical protein
MKPTSIPGVRAQPLWPHVTCDPHSDCYRPAHQAPACGTSQHPLIWTSTFINTDTIPQVVFMVSKPVQLLGVGICSSDFPFTAAVVLEEVEPCLVSLTSGSVEQQVRIAWMKYYLS